MNCSRSGRCGRGCWVGWLCVLVFGDARAADPVGATRFEFTADPDWDGYRNRLLGDRLRETRQDFGYRTSQHAGGAHAGEVGGFVQRSTTPAYYALPIPPRDADQTLVASGKLAVTAAEGGSGALVGWFHDQSSRGWRTPNSVAMRIDGNGGSFWLFFEYGTRDWQTGGGGAFAGDRYQTTPTPPFRADGAAHDWRLEYDPHAASGRGMLRLSIDDREYEYELPEGHRQAGFELNRFGIWNQHSSGDGLELYLDDLTVDGQRLEFDQDPAWDTLGNQAKFLDRVRRPLHDFGHSRSQHAGAQLGEIGGIFFRDEQPAYYAARRRVSTLDTPLRAAGKIAMLQGGADSGVYLGWFDSASKRAKTDADYDTPQRNYLGAAIEGPSRVGHYFRSVYATREGASGGAPLDGDAAALPSIIRPDGRAHDWALQYDPRAAEGRGALSVVFDGREHRVELTAEQRRQGAVFDRFGVFTIQAGGNHLELYLDDLEIMDAGAE